MMAQVGKGRTSLTVAVLSAAAILCLTPMAADTGWTATFKSVNGEVVIEAENYTRLGGTVGGTWYQKDLIPGYTGSGYIRSTTDDPNTLRFRSRTINAQYDIDFQQTGTYFLHLRTYAADHNENGFFATLDGEPFDYGHIDAHFAYVKKFPENPRWWWYTDGGGVEGRGYEVSTTITKTGIQTLAIYRRDKGSRIDRIWLTKNENVPQDTGTLALTNPAVFMYPAPIADAGLDQVVIENAVVALDGTLSVEGYADAPITDYLWVQTLGTGVLLTDADTATPTFTAPPMDAAGETLTFQLTVTAQDGQQASDQVNVSVVVAPVADAGEAQRVSEGAAVTLDATGSTGSDLTYLWEQTGAGTWVTLTGANSATATFTAPMVSADAPETLTFRLLVTDDVGLFSEDTVEVTVNPLSTPSIGGDDIDVGSSGGGGGGGCFINSL